MSLVLNSLLRLQLGKSASKNSKINGLVPCVVYAKDGKNIHILLSLVYLQKLINEDPSLCTRVIKLNVFKDIDNASISNFKIVPDEKPFASHDVMIRDIQFDAITDRVCHVDLAIVEKDDEISVKIPVKFTNKHLSNVLKFGGFLHILCYNPQIRAKVSSIPEALEVDLAGAKAGKVIRISDLPLPGGCSIIKDSDIAIVSGKDKSE